MKPQGLVMAFAERVITCSFALRGEFSEASREDPRSPLSLVTSLDGHRVREGGLEGIGEFRVHGIGCRFELSTGEVVDFDWDDDGREVFDAWRLLQYARSVGV